MKRIIGNWKMNGRRSSIDMIEEIDSKFGARELNQVQVGLCIPATLISTALSRLKSGSNIAIGGQDCSIHDEGAHTGEISAKMLDDIGADFVIVGHSERRTDHHETNAQISQKAVRAIESGLTPIICIGESKSMRENNDHLDFVAKQLTESLPKDGEFARRIILAYEPIWAIGTGLTASVSEIEQMHNHIHNFIHSLWQIEDSAAPPILYGGSMNENNATSILSVPYVDGGLIGGASLKESSFSAIIESALSLR